MILDSEIIQRVQHLTDIVDKHEKWRGNDCLNLISSENIMSLKARSLLSSDLVHRYTARDNFYGGTRFINEIESFVAETASKVFNSFPTSKLIFTRLKIANKTTNKDAKKK